jgi:Immunity protein 42
MIIGTPSALAIESGISRGYERPSLRALGFFVLHIGGRRYGVHAQDATMLANSFDEVGRRVAASGTHTAAFLTKDAGEIATAVCLALYIPDNNEKEEGLSFGLSRDGFRQLVYSRHLLWGPDGDQAFDDGSHVLQMEDTDRVRLIAFKREHGDYYEPDSLSDVWLSSDEFYRTLMEWHEAFEKEWKASPKWPSP